MYDLLRAWLGPASCPWCLPVPPDLTLFDRVYNRMPLWLCKALTPYDSWVGKVGHKIHAHHPPRFYDPVNECT